jgi:anti-sigma factor RsiW
MIDFLRNSRKSEADKSQEAITAYLDDALTAGDRQRLEQQMAADPALRADMEQQRLIKLNISRLPQVRAPRNFTLDPALYGRPARQSSARLYPAMRVATVLVGVFFIIAVSAEILTFDSRASVTGSLAEQIVELAPAEDAVMESEAVTAQEAEPAAALEVAPQTGSDSDGAVPASEEAAPMAPEEGQLQEQPAEALGAAADEDKAESEEVAEESFADAVVTAVAGAAAEKNVTEEAVAESAPRALMPEEEQGEAGGAPAAEPDDGQADLAAGGGDKPEDAPQPGVLMTGVAGRTTPAATETATSQPTVTMSVVPQEEALAEAPMVAAAKAPEAIPAETELAESQDDGSDLPLLRVVILLLGIILVLLAAVTLKTRWRLKGQA